MPEYPGVYHAAVYMTELDPHVLLSAHTAFARAAEQGNPLAQKCLDVFQRMDLSLAEGKKTTDAEVMSIAWVIWGLENDRSEL